MSTGGGLWTSGAILGPSVATTSPNAEAAEAVVRLSSPAGWADRAQDLVRPRGRTTSFLSATKIGAAPLATGGTRMVAPGLVLSDREYDERFGSLDLESYRARMTAPAFAAFVRFAGVVAGSGAVDYSEGLTADFES